MISRRVCSQQGNLDFQITYTFTVGARYGVGVITGEFAIISINRQVDRHTCLELLARSRVK